MESYATAQQVFAGGLVFARLGAIVMLLPGIGETFISPRIRLAFAFSLALMLFPVVAGRAPPLPGDASALAGAVIKEVMIGLMIGAILRLFMSSLANAGEIISLQTTLSFAQTANPMQAAPSTTIGTFLGMIGIVLIFATNLDHLFVAAIVRSFELFPFTRDVPVADAGQLAIQTVGRSFALGLQLAAPVVVFSLIFNIAVGLVGRVMPQFQVFFVATPIMLLLSLSIFALSLGVIGMVWIDRYRELVGSFIPS
jgi:flagellar biosynthetic protein FliR